MSNPWNPSFDQATPRQDERQRVREELEGRLSRGGVQLTGSETDDQLVDLSNAFEAFDLARARLGGDSMVNTAASSRPDDERLVLPERRDDESVERYLSRVRAATELLLGARGR
ncbi:MAG: hypothetical protein ACHQWU_00375 [Gemmatimonadales bacterium]|jgi:hypothetical protein